MCWQYLGSTSKSISELNCLWSYVKDPLFNLADELSFSHDKEHKCIEKNLQNESNPFNTDHGLLHSPVKIPLMKYKVKYMSQEDPSIPTITIEVIHCSLTNIIKSVFEDDFSSTFHMTPFQQFWNTSEDHVLKVYLEAYSSPAMLNAYQEINSLLREAGDKYKCVVVSLMLCSDATQLANFGDASLWPIYLFFGNESKYTQAKPSSGVCHHAAYIPTVCSLKNS
ncbi:hypothetical protein SERLA73DRAFT_66308 [Serpula lacrymans var. lacrymans S7.3]|uniref:Uncharacterized protein n=1 Tax=Serpula lacrymans var. lacrymans (strain S7.3) TaxID=936435 RepID=F8QHV6_SERL3|nr:hypothetical protein SERLA73DRAFT_66308 [Serpula lacrymans var. lacrymans S7.3]